LISSFSRIGFGSPVVFNPSFWCLYASSLVFFSFRVFLEGFHLSLSHPSEVFDQKLFTLHMETTGLNPMRFSLWFGALVSFYSSLDGGSRSFFFFFDLRPPLLPPFGDRNPPCSIRYFPSAIRCLVTCGSCLRF